VVGILWLGAMIGSGAVFNLGLPWWATAVLAILIGLVVAVWAADKRRESKRPEYEKQLRQYEDELERWQHSYLCERCGKIFELAN